jgi:hypothetical protein
MKKHKEKALYKVIDLMSKDETLSLITANINYLDDDKNYELYFFDRELNPVYLHVNNYLKEYFIITKKGNNFKHEQYDSKGNFIYSREGQKKTNKEIFNYRWMIFLCGFSSMCDIDFDEFLSEFSYCY